jgi:hypothetical protein
MRDRRSRCQGRPSVWPSACAGHMESEVQDAQSEVEGQSLVDEEAALSIVTQRNWILDSQICEFRQR